MSFDMTGFKEFSFADGSPYVTITANGMNFNKAVVNKLNSCEYARLLINVQKKQIILVEAQKEDSNAYRFYNDKRRSNNKSVRWNSKELLNTVSRMMEWDGVQSTLRLDINKRSYRNNSCSFLGSKETSKDCPVLSDRKFSIWYLSLTFKLNVNISGKYPISFFF